MEIIAVTDAEGVPHSNAWLARCAEVHRQLRPQLPDDYSGRMAQVFASGGRMIAAVENEKVLGLAVFRVLSKTSSGCELYVDDLLTAEGERSRGVGQMLVEWLKRWGRENGCWTLTLDSGTQRYRAHRFYMREGFEIQSFHFVCRLD
jgi:Acetyltransferase (GNAT) family.